MSAKILFCLCFPRTSWPLNMELYAASACYEYNDQGTMIAAANPSLFNNKAACGKSYKVKCTGAINQGPNPCRGGTITVKIVDHCPGCGKNQLDLSQQAFSMIANPDAGRIRIHYTKYNQSFYFSFLFY